MTTCFLERSGPWLRCDHPRRGEALARRQEGQLVQSCSRGDPRRRPLQQMAGTRLRRSLRCAVIVVICKRKSLPETTKALRRGFLHCEAITYRIPYAETFEALPPLCRGRWATLAWLGGGVRLDFVGEYRTMAFTMSIAFTPSVTPKGVTAPPTQGSLWLVQTGSPYFDFYDSVIVSWRAGPASPRQCPAGRYLKSPHTRYRKNPPAGGISLTGGSFYCILSHLCRFRSLFSRF